MANERKGRIPLEQIREAMREWESEPSAYDPDFARTYAGEWVVIHRGQVVAHGKKGSEIAQAANVNKFPGSRILYVPTLEEQDGVWILPGIRLDA